MKPILCLSILLASFASADEAADKIAIGKAMESLNVITPGRAIFTDDFRDDAELAEFAVHDGSMHVEISHEPWREATITGTQATRFVIRSVRFVTADVALVEALGRRGESDTPALLVMKRDGLFWRIATVRATYR